MPSGRGMAAVRGLGIIRGYKGLVSLKGHRLSQWEQSQMGFFAGLWEGSAPVQQSKREDWAAWQVGWSQQMPHHACCAVCSCESAEATGMWAAWCGVQGPEFLGWPFSPEKCLHLASAVSVRRKGHPSG